MACDLKQCCEIAWVQSALVWVDIWEVLMLVFRVIPVLRSCAKAT